MRRRLMAAVPARLADKSSELVESVNDWHYAMINDHPRNEFFRCLAGARRSSCAALRWPRL